jgi:hypothetical protein
MGESSSTVIEGPSRAELLNIWHLQRVPWKTREEAEEDFDLYLSGGYLDISREGDGWRLNIVTKKTRQ